jgi:serine O-acetyltransferase
MSARVIALFESENRRRGDSLGRLIISDYLAYYHNYGRAKESPPRLALLFLPRLFTNPCLHATVMIRLALAGPRMFNGLWRTVLIAKHSIDIHHRMTIGPGLMLPHPTGILLGWGLEVGSNVVLLHNLSIGRVHQPEEGATQLSPVIGDDVIIYPGAMLFGPITIGDGAVIGAGAWVTRDVPPGATVRGVGPTLAKLQKTLAAGETPEPPGNGRDQLAPETTGD